MPFAGLTAGDLQSLPAPGCNGHRKLYAPPARFDDDVCAAVAEEMQTLRRGPPESSV